MRLSIKALMLFLALGIVSGLSSTLRADNINPPDRKVRLIFIHHSTGEAWLDDYHGELGLALRDNGYFVSDTNYDWGPTSPLGAIGSNTDIGHWWTWFRSVARNKYMNALFAESAQHSGYSRLDNNPGGPNEIIMFKSCFPNSALKGEEAEPIPPIASNQLRGQSSDSDFHTISNAKGIYIDILKYFQTKRDKLFIVITAPPLSDPTYAANARAFNNWLVSEWLKDYPYKNVFVFDFYNVLTTNGGSAEINDLDRETGNHHRWWNDAIQHVTNSDDDDPDVLEYPSGDDHPSRAGDLKATGEFLKLLNIAYNRWRPALGEALDNTTLEWTSGGNSKWFGQTAAGFYQDNSARSGPVSHGRSSYLQTNVTGPGTLKFYWRVSSQPGRDLLCLVIDGALKAKISGTTGWVQKSYILDAGPHVIKWVYKKDGSISGGSDAGWVDKVEWSGS